MKRVWVTAGLVAGLLGYLMTGILYLGAGLVMPQALVPFMWTIWFVGAWFAVRVARRRSLWVLASGPVALVLWTAIVSTGEWLFNWTA